MSRAFEVGDVVRLKSGGPQMTVGLVNDYGPGCARTVVVTWTDNYGADHNKLCPVDILELVTANRPEGVKDMFAGTLDQLRSDTVSGLKMLLGNPLAQMKMTADQKREAQAAVQVIGSGQGDAVLRQILQTAEEIDKDDCRDDIA